MPLTLELPEDLEQRLAAEATRLGLPVEDYALRVLSGQTQAESRPVNGAKLVDYWQREGLIGSRPDIADSPSHARAVRRRAERRSETSGELVDTDILIDVLRGHAPAVEWFRSLDELPSVPGFAVMELIQDADDEERIQKALKLVAPLRVLWPSADHCALALADFRRFHLSHGLGLLDALIGACAIERSATLLTFNHKHYRVNPNLSMAEPYAR